VTLIAGSKRRSLLTRDDDKMFMTRRLRVTTKTTEHHLIVRSDKSVAYVTNKKIPCSAFCAIGANYWQTASVARLLCDSSATKINLFRKQFVDIIDFHFNDCDQMLHWYRQELRYWAKDYKICGLSGKTGSCTV